MINESFLWKKFDDYLCILINYLTDDKYDSSFLFPQINANAMTNALSEESRAWVTLGQRLGQLAGSIGGQTTGQIKVTACGRLSFYS